MKDNPFSPSTGLRGANNLKKRDKDLNLERFFSGFLKFLRFFFRFLGFSGFLGFLLGIFGIFGIFFWGIFEIISQNFKISLKILTKIFFELFAPRGVISGMENVPILQDECFQYNDKNIKLHIIVSDIKVITCSERRALSTINH